MVLFLFQNGTGSFEMGPIQQYTVFRNYFKDFIYTYINAYKQMRKW